MEELYEFCQQCRFKASTPEVARMWLLLETVEVKCELGGTPSPRVTELSMLRKSSFGFGAGG